MKRNITLLISLLLLGLGSTVSAEKLRVLDRGLDGNVRYYLITCPDGNRSSVSREFNFREDQTTPTGNPKVVKTCIYSHNGTHECNPRWHLDQAAELSCK